MIYLSIYNSPNCLPLLNYETTVLNSTDNIYSNLFKLIPSDYSTINFSTNGTYYNLDLGLGDYQNFVNEIESYELMKSYNYTNLTYFMNINNHDSTLTLNCYSSNNNNEQFCQRNFIFYLFTYDANAQSYQTSLSFQFDLPVFSTNTSNINSALITQINKIIWPSGLKSEPSSAIPCLTSSGK